MLKIFAIILSLFYFKISFSQNPELTLQTGHSSAITTMAFSKDGKYMASVGKDNIIILWDFNLCKQLKVFNGHKGKINDIKFYNNSSKLLSSGEDGKVLVCDLKSGNIIHSFEIGTPVTSIDITKNDSLIIISGMFPNIKIYRATDFNLYSEITLWDKSDTTKYIRKRKFNKIIYYPLVINFKCKLVNNNHDLLVTRATIDTVSNKIIFREPIYIGNFNNNNSKNFYKFNFTSNEFCYDNKNKNAFFCSESSKILNYNTNNYKLNYSRIGNFKKSEFLSISINSNDSIFSSLNSDRTIYLWDIKGNFFSNINLKDNFATAILFHPIKKEYLIIGDENGKIFIYNIFNGQIVRKMDSGIHQINKLTVNDNCDKIAIASDDFKIRVFDIKNKINEKCYFYNKDIVTGLTFNTDSTLISSSKDNKIYKWNINNNKLLNKTKSNSNVQYFNSLINIPILSVFINPFTFFYFTNTFLIKKYESINSISLNKKNKIVAFAGNGFNKGLINKIFVPRILPINIFNSDSLKKVLKLKGHYISINSVDFNNTGSILASSGVDYKTNISISKKSSINRHSAFEKYNSLKIFNVANKSLYKIFEIPNEITNIKFSNNSDTLAFVDNKNNVLLFDYKSNYIKKIANGTWPLLFSNDDKNLYFQDNKHSLVCYNNTTNDKYSLQTHNNLITDAVFNSKQNQIITCGLDGTIKIWDCNKNCELITLYALNDNDFIVKTPDYYYYATKNAKREIGFTFGIKFYPFEQFDLQYNRPDIVLGRMGLADKNVINAFKLAYNKRLKKMGFTEEMFTNEFHLPETTILNADSIPLYTENEELTISVNVTDSKYKLNRLNVWVNNVPIYGTNGISLINLSTGAFSKTFKIKLNNGSNKLQFSCMNEKGVESLKENIEINYLNKNAKKPDLYLVAIGASEYVDKDWNLKYASKDANDICNLFTEQKQLFNKINILKLINKDITLSKINEVKNFIKKSDINDLVVVFYAGHGLLDDSLNYYLSTNTINFNNPSENGLKYEDLDELLDSISSRNKLLLIDACHSGEVDKENNALLSDIVVEKDIVFRGAKPRGFNSKNKINFNNSFELMKELFSDLRRGTGAVIVSSAGGGEFAFEGDNWQNGVFTYSLIDGLKNMKADINNDGSITISELQNYIVKQVQKLTNGMQQPTMRQENIENDFIIWR